MAPPARACGDATTKSKRLDDDDDWESTRGARAERDAMSTATTRRRASRAADATSTRARRVRARARRRRGRARVTNDGDDDDDARTTRAPRVNAVGSSARLKSVEKTRCFRLGVFADAQYGDKVDETREDDATRTKRFRASERRLRSAYARSKSSGDAEWDRKLG